MSDEEKNGTGKNGEHDPALPPPYPGDDENMKDGGSADKAAGGAEKRPAIKLALNKRSGKKKSGNKKKKGERQAPPPDKNAEYEFDLSDFDARKWLVKAALLFFAYLVVRSTFYTVDQAEQVVVTMFGRPVRVILNPIADLHREDEMATIRKTYEGEGIKVTRGAGLKVKIPFIQNVRRFDRRLLRWNGYPEEIPTRDKKYIWVDTTARWYIVDPLKFLRSVGTEEQAQARLDDIIDSATRNSITQRDLIEIVRTDNREMQIAEEELRETLTIGTVKEGRPKIVNEINSQSRKFCRDLGMDIHERGTLVKGLTYVESVRKEVEDRMIAERKRISKKYLSEGEGEYNKIMGQKDQDVKRIVSEAYKTAREIEGAADAKAIDIYAKGYSRDPEFYKFQQTLKLYEDTLKDRTTIIIGTDNPLFKLLKGDVD